MTFSSIRSVMVHTALWVIVRIYYNPRGIGILMSAGGSKLQWCMSVVTRFYVGAH